MRWSWAIVTFLSGCVACLLLVSLGVIDRVDGAPGTEQEPMLSLPTYLNFVGVMLTAVTVILAALAILIGIVAAYTFRELAERAESAAKRAADEALSDDKIAARLQEVAVRMNTAGISTDELEERFDSSDSGER